MPGALITAPTASTADSAAPPTATGHDQLAPRRKPAAPAAVKSASEDSPPDGGGEGEPPVEQQRERDGGTADDGVRTVRRPLVTNNADAVGNVQDLRMAAADVERHIQS